LDAGAAEQLDAEYGDHERVAARPVDEPVEPQQLGVASGVGRDPQLVLEHRTEAVRAVGGGERGGVEQPARVVVEPGLRRGRVEGPELGGEREEQLVGFGAGAIGDLGERGGHRCGIPTWMVGVVVRAP
jgi:hypothetical protein